MTLTSDKYETLYTELRHDRTACCKVQRLTVAYNNNRYAKAVVYKYKDISSLNYTQFIQTLKREVRFKDKRSSIYYYTKTADIATKLYRATFIIKLLI
ncbi:hypothetical protein HBI29_184680 [Parastagonospora nodorum]|nr:hypothetical protein HBI29_184680 [Parastagonospora nodorum]